MGTLTLNKMNHLFWLGRYTERVYTTTKFMLTACDPMLDGEEIDYPGICQALIIPNIYKDSDDFCTRFLFDKENPDSIASSLQRAYDNAIVLRETISTEALSYIFMAISAMESAAVSASPAVDLQWVIDDILAFRGSSTDYIDDDSRRVLQCGSSVERIDLCVRLDYNHDQVHKEINKLLNRLYKTKITCDTKRLESLANSMLGSGAAIPPRDQLLDWVDGLFLI